MISWFGRAEDGASVRITLDPNLATSLAERWPKTGLSMSGLAQRKFRHATRAEALAVTERFDLELVLSRRNDLDRIESELGLFAVAHLSQLVAVHAALLVCDGQAILIPGASFAGKSTLALAAARAGITVASDEYALIDPETGLAVGVARLVRQRMGSGVRRIDVAKPIDPVPIGLVAALSWNDGRPQITRIGATDVAMALLANTVCAQIRPNDSFRAALAVARTARGIGGHRGEATTTVDLLVRAIAA